MSCKIISGPEVAGQIYDELRVRIDRMKSSGLTPGLAVILVGNDPASQVYVRNKGRKCEELGMHSETIVLPEETTEEELLARIDALNKDPAIHGFLVQLPLPGHIDEDKVIQAIDPAKDVDGFHPINVGRMSIGLPCFRSATPQGILTLLERYNISTSGKHCVVLGRSNIVGKPVAQMLLQKANPGNCTVTICHSATKDIAAHCRRADILIAAIGQPEFVKADMVKEGAVVIDVGTTRLPSTATKSGFKLHGDVDFDSVAPLCSHITPVPGGVGPMTICSLMKNTLLAAQHKIYQ